MYKLNFNYSLKLSEIKEIKSHELFENNDLRIDYCINSPSNACKLNSTPFNLNMYSYYFGRLSAEIIESDSINYSKYGHNNDDVKSLINSSNYNFNLFIGK